MYSINRRIAHLELRLRRLEAADRWTEFLEEKYQGGKKKLPNPNPETKAQHPSVTVDTVLKGQDQGSMALKKKIRKEFEGWLDRHPETKRLNKERTTKVVDLADDLKLGPKSLSKLKKLLTEPFDPKDLRNEIREQVAKQNALHKKHLYMGDDPEKEPHPQAQKMTDHALFILQGEGKKKLDQLKEVFSHLGIEKAETVRDWVKSTVLLQQYKNLDAGKKITW